MPGVATSAHLLTAVTEALTTDRVDSSRPRALPSSRLFAAGFPPGFDRTIRSARAKVKPGVFVMAVRLSPNLGLAEELGDQHLYRCTLIVSRDYHVSFERDPAAHLAVMARVLDDAMAVRAALCSPGALASTAAGDATGVEGRGLTPLDELNAISIEQVGDGRDRLVNARDSFVAILNYAPDSIAIP
jgi:hypothetical protein